MKNSVERWILFFIATPWIAGAVELDVQQFGAKNDGKTLDTQFIQRAIDECSKQGGGMVRFPPGDYVSGTILLKDNVSLVLDEHAKLLGSLNIADYTAPDKFRSGNGAEMGYCFIGAVGATNVTVTGGLIDGRGKELLAARPKGNNTRPFLMRFVRCRGVVLTIVHLQGPAAWTAHFFQCELVIADKVTIKSTGLANNDGFDIDSSQMVRITNCNVDSGDDAICLKTTSLMPCEDVEIRGCDLKSHWGGVKFGTESVGNFRNVTIADCKIRDTRGGIKLFSVDGANIRDILFTNLTMENVNTPIFIRLGARLKTFREGDKQQPVGSMRNIVVKDLKVQATSPIGILISGIPGHPVAGVRLENIDMKLPGGGTQADIGVVLAEKESSYPEITMFGNRFPSYGLYARHVSGLLATNVTVELTSPDGRPAVSSQDVQSFDVSHWNRPVVSGAH